MAKAVFASNIISKTYRRMHENSISSFERFDLAF